MSDFSKTPEPLQAWVGREQSAREVLTAGRVRQYCATLDLPLEDRDLRPGAPAPGLIHFCLMTPGVETRALSGDGHPPRGDFLPPVPLPRRMWAGGEILRSGDLCIGDEVVRHSRIASVQERTGRSGPLCFVTVQHDLSVGGRTVVSERQDLVYREAPGSGSGSARPGGAEQTGRYREPVSVSPVLLFRFSAITFNSHRIHYDLPYARDVEGYPALVVHGPLQACLLFHYAARLRGTPPVRFAFRSGQPLFDDAPAFLNADEDDEGGLTLWTAADGGPPAMTATAAWHRQAPA